MDLSALLPLLGGAAWQAAAFVVALSIIVFVHEFGHYIVGRLSGIQAEVFSLGFGPVLWSRMDRRGTRWQVAALPLGGFVKFRGDADAASARAAELEGLSPAERRATLGGAPLWARTATVAAGPLFNFALSLLVFAAFALVMGVASERPVVGSVAPLPGFDDTLRPGDVITALDGQATPDTARFAKVAADLPPAPVARYDILRDGAALSVQGPFPLPPRVAGVYPNTAASDAGLREGDVITALNGCPVQAFRQVEQTIRASEGRPQQLTVWRDGQVFDVTLIPRRSDTPLADGGFETRWLIGLSAGLVVTMETRTPGLVEAVGLSAQMIWNLVSTTLSGLWHMLTGAISSCNLGGPLRIAETAGAAASAGTPDFIWMIAALSTAVGLMNLFPIPVLDGGHLMVYLYEAIARRPPTERVMQRITAIGLTLVLGLMIFALTNDLFC